MSGVLVEPGGCDPLEGEKDVDEGLTEGFGGLGVGLRDGTGLAEVGGGLGDLKAGTAIIWSRTIRMG